MEGGVRLGWPVWIGVVSEDLEAQRRFYRDVLGHPRGGGGGGLGAVRPRRTDGGAAGHPDRRRPGIGPVLVLLPRSRGERVRARSAPLIASPAPHRMRLGAGPNRTGAQAVPRAEEGATPR